MCSWFLFVCFLLPLFYFTDVPKVTVLQNTMAKLPCPHTKRDASWSRLQNSEHVILVSTENGRERRTDKRFSCQADNSLVILNVKPSDSRMYFCNQIQIYLEVTTDPSVVTPATPRLGLDLGPGQNGVTADKENQQSSDFWKVPAGVVVGAALTLLSILTLRLCLKKSRETNTDVDKPATEGIYEEIEEREEQADVESPYWISEMPSASAPPYNNLYSTVNKLKTKGHSSEECVYYLAQTPP